MNKAILAGRLTDEPKAGSYQNGGYAKYTLAIDRRGNNGTDYINVTAFGKGGEFANKYFHKGQRVLVEGRIQTSSYEKNGVKMYTFEVIAESQEFADGKRNEQ